MHFILLTMVLFVKHSGIRKGRQACLQHIVNGVSEYLCICQEPDNSDHFKGQGLASQGGLYGLSYSGGEGVGPSGG